MAFRTCEWFVSGKCIQMNGELCDQTKKTEITCSAYTKCLEQDNLHLEN